MRKDSIKTRELPVLPPDWIILLARALKDEYSVYIEQIGSGVVVADSLTTVTTEELADFIWSKYQELP